MTWPMAQLAELADGKGALVDGPFGSNLKASEYMSDGVPIIRLQNIRPNVFLTKDIKFVSNDKAKELARHNYKAGDLVIAKLGDPCGMTCVIPDLGASGVIVADVVRFRGRNIDHHLLSYYLNSPAGQAQFARRAKGATRQRVNLADIKEILVPVPPVDDQRRIVDLLSRAQSIVGMRREAETKAKEIIPALFLDMFGDPATNPKGWVFRAIGDAADIQGGLQVTTKRASLPLEVPYLRVANVHRTHLDLSEIKLIRATEAELNRTRLLPGDLLVIEGHGNPAEIGRVGIWPGGIDPCVHQNHLIRVRCTPPSFHPIYVWAYLNSADGRRFLLREGKTTSGLNTISVSNVKGVKVPAPPIELQKTFAARISEVTALQGSQQTASIRAKDAFQSLLAGVFGDNGRVGPANA